MKKSSLFISAVLSTFILAILAGVITAYRASAAGNTSTNLPAPVVAVTTPQPAVDAQQAAQIAAKFLGEKDLYSVTNVTLNGLSVYKVTFSNGTVAYVSPAGQVVSVVTAPVTVIRTGSSTSSSATAVQPASPSFEHESEDGDHD